MKSYEKFLERVKEENQDEFSEIMDILSRYKQLEMKNKELIAQTDEYTK